MHASVISSGDTVTQCAEGATRCATGAGKGGCCTTENAVCCNNMKHCCPEGYTCDTENELCMKKFTSSFLSIHQNSSLSEYGSPALVDGLTPRVVHCPDKVSVCPDNNKCCVLKDHHGYGCCAGLNSICCDDQLHCCPEGTVCDLKNKNCTKKPSSLSALKTYTPSPRSILCPDGSTTCPDGNTCCELIVKGTYGCCPKPGASCCADKLNCCPHGYSCDPHSDKCAHSDLSIPMFAKVPLLPRALLLDDQKTVCPDDTLCGVNDTCCEHLDGSWGCCPTPNAVCCSDGHHCCPEKFTCEKDYTCKENSKTRAAMKIQNHQSPGVKITPASETSRIYNYLFHVVSTVCTGGGYECASGQTCCNLSSGGWGCCRENEAVCCSDGEHCCPKGFVCSTGGKCVKNFPTYKDIL